MTSKLHEFRLSLLGKDIFPVQSAKDLGVILDSNLTHLMTILRPQYRNVSHALCKLIVSNTVLAERRC